MAESSAFSNTDEVSQYSDHSTEPHQSRQSCSDSSSLAFSTSDKMARQQQGSASSHMYVDRCAAMEKMFIQLATKNDGISEGDSVESNPWTPLVSLLKPYPITIQGHATKPFCFRVTFYAPTAPATAFDLLADVTRRPEWDELTDSAKIVEKLGNGDAIHYIKMKPIWPTAARDSVLLARITDIALGSSSAGRKSKGFLNVSQSVEDSRIPENTAEGLVRMEAGIAGQLITEVPEEEKQKLNLEGEKWCKVVQIADGDLKGWIPSSVLKFIATQALPRSLTKVCKQLADMPVSTESQLLLRNIQSNGGLLQQRQNSTQNLLSVSSTSSTAVDNTASQQRETSTPAVLTRNARLSSKHALVSHRGSWAAWLRLFVRYATPAVIAAITSIIVTVLLGKQRWRRGLVGRR
ncbi:hypothetical protein EDC05_001342 [Coemansia umbellata]|uniref:START domain-containing protein n=1 Tax=Coemansia umbellata TaxID=1424467 RepID=A0ABQ8PS75_9FUNG|nr:hypothetical protein EDC05_001342 [Coemansia umbellata]